MSALRQLLLGLAAIAATIWIWVLYVPSAAGWLQGTGVLDALGIELAQAQDGEAEGGGRRFGGGGPSSVVVAEVGQGTINDRITAIGDGRAERSVTLRSDAPGRITAVEYEAGRYVNEGEIIVQLEDTAERIALERAELVLQEARRDVERLSQLQNTGAVSTVAFRDAEVALRTAELQLREAEVDLQDRAIRAPIPGWIGLLEVEIGDRIPAQEELATITDRSRILIDFRVPERVIGQLRLGQEMTATALALPDQPLTGQITAIDNIVDRASRTLRVQGTLENNADSLRAGMAFSVALSFEGQTYPSVDPLAVQWSSEGSYVWAVREGKAVRVPVIIRQRNADAVLVEAELEPGEQIVIEGVQTLRPGAEVQAADASLAEPRASAAARRI